MNLEAETCRYAPEMQPFAPEVSVTPDSAPDLVVVIGDEAQTGAELLGKTGGRPGSSILPFAARLMLRANVQPADQAVEGTPSLTTKRHVGTTKGTTKSTAPSTPGGRPTQDTDTTADLQEYPD